MLTFKALHVRLTILRAQMYFYQGFVREKTEFITVLINLECKLH